MKGIGLGLLLVAPFMVVCFWLMAIDLMPIGIAVLLLPAVWGLVSMWRDERSAKRKVKEPAGMARTVHLDSTHGELEQTPEWWDRQYQALERKHIPRDAASHDGHSIVDQRTYASTTARRHCTDCCIEIDPYEEDR